MQELNPKQTTPYFTESQADSAFELARQTQLPVLVDFWVPGCKGCKKMEITTYQHPDIQQYIGNSFVPVKYDITNRAAPKLQSSPILWTPTFIVFANDRSEVRKITGYLNDSQFMAEMEIGRALAFLRKAQAQTALKILEALISGNDQQSILPETLYWAGVASYFQNQRNPESLAPYWQKLLVQHPGDAWAQRADCLEITF